MTEEVPTIRPAGREDVEGLLDLYQHLVPGDERVAAPVASAILEQIQRFSGSAVLVAEIGGILAGSCTLLVVPNLTRGGRPFALVENVVTHGAFRKRGIGTTLLRVASEAAWEAGCYKVMLLSGSADPAILKFYRDAGFEQSKTGFQKRRIAERQEC